MKRIFVLTALVTSTFASHAQQTSSLYLLGPAFPKYVTAHIGFRDPTGTRWPSFFYGKPSGNGVVNLDAKRASATFKIVCDQRPQKNGDQSRRVLGDIFNDVTKSNVVVQVNAMSDLIAGENGAMKATLSGSIELPGKSVPFTAAASLRPHAAAKSDEKNEALMIEFRFESKASELGLKTFEPPAPIEIRCAVTAYSEAAVSAATTRRR
jgi:hypothetical protein